MSQRIPTEASLRPTPRGRWLALFGVLVSTLYLANFTLGVLELPDNLPLVGNLDEVFFSGVLFASLAKLGINVLPGSRRTG